MYEINCDGSSMNPGPGGWAFVVYCDSKELFTNDGFSQDTTNNVMEYTAVINAMLYASNHLRGEMVNIYTDSKLVVEHYYGRWKCRNARLGGLLGNLRKLGEKTRCEIHWVPREQNTRADELCRAAMRRGMPTVNS